MKIRFCRINILSLGYTYLFEFMDDATISFKFRRFPKDIILMAVRWKLAYPLSYRAIEELMDERGVQIDHSSVQRWVATYAPQLEQAFRSRKKAVGRSWCMDETYIKVNGKWVYRKRQF